MYCIDFSLCKTILFFLLRDVMFQRKSRVVQVVKILILIAFRQRTIIPREHLPNVKGVIF